MCSALRSFVLPASLALVLAGCTGGSDGPAEQYSTAVDHMQAGELTGAYDSVMPASYRSDLDDVVDKAQELIDETEFNRIRDLLRKAGTKLAPMFQQMAQQEAAVKPLVDKIEDLPGALGLESYGDYTALDARGLLEKIETSIMKPLLETPEAKAQLGTTEVSLLESGEGKATLKVVTTRPDQEPEEQEVEVVEVEGKWIPADMAEKWDEGIRTAKARLDELLEQKKAQPDLLVKQLDMMEQQLDQQLPMFGMMLQSLMQQATGGGQGTPPGPGAMPPPGSQPGSSDTPEDSGSSGN